MLQVTMRQINLLERMELNADHDRPPAWPFSELEPCDREADPASGRKALLLEPVYDFEARSDEEATKR